MQRPRRSAARWLASSGLFGYFSLTVQGHLPKDGTAHSGLVTISNQENAPRTFPQANLLETIP